MKRYCSTRVAETEFMQGIESKVAEVEIEVAGGRRRTQANGSRKSAGGEDSRPIAQSSVQNGQISWVT